MLCEGCALMFEEISEDYAKDGGQRFASMSISKLKEDDPLFILNCGVRLSPYHATVDHLRAAATKNCYICSGIFNQLETVCGWGFSIVPPVTVPLLIPRYVVDMHKNQIEVLIERHLDPWVSDSIDSWQYAVVPLSQRQDCFGFDVSGINPHSVQIEHRHYRPLPPTTGSPEVGALARSWLQKCLQSHTQCLQRDTTSDTPWYPPRLLDVTCSKPRLINQDEVQYGERFAVASHCWGTTKFLTLTSDNLDNFRLHGIPRHDMPQNFCDVIQICQWLHIRYVWIDSLCIIQSGAGNKEDWAHHVNIMGHIYSESELCIATAATTSATVSCFRERDLHHVKPCVVQINDVPHLIIGSDHKLRGFQNAPLFSRGWVFQERLLSRRILTFSHQQVFWECQETLDKNWCETFPRGIDVECFSLGQFALPQQSSSNGDAKNIRTWNKLIDNYCTLDLSHSDEDKLAAFSSVAQHMQHVFGGAQYIAGRFDFELPDALLWYVVLDLTKYTYSDPILQTYRAPSWSWAVTNGPIMRSRMAEWTLRGDGTDASPKIYMTTVLDHIIVAAKPDDVFGQLLHAELVLRTILVPIYWEVDWDATLSSKGTEKPPHTRFRIPGLGIDGNEGFSHKSNTGVRLDTVEELKDESTPTFFMPVFRTESGSDYTIIDGLLIRRMQKGADISSFTRWNAVVDEHNYKRIGYVQVYGGGILQRLKSFQEQIIRLL